MKKSFFVLYSILKLQGSCEEIYVPHSFFEAIKFVESTCGSYYGDQDNGKSNGPYQISLAYLSDANEWLSWHGERVLYTMKSVMESDTCAIAVMCAYFSRYTENVPEGEVTLEMLARIHNGGPNGHKKESTLKYWKKVEKAMKDIEAKSKPVLTTNDSLL